jgi:hypothetical protein
MKYTALALVCFANVATAQASRPLGPSQREHPFEFSNVSELRELSDGRLIVIDRSDRIIHLVDFARGTAERIAREGSGPNEIVQPTSLLPLPGDTTAVWDGRNARLLYIGPDGKPLRADRLAADNGAAMTLELRAPRYTDAAGRIYFAGIPVVHGAGADSIPLIRFDRRSARIDTVGTLRAPKAEPATVGPPGRQVTLALTNPFGPQHEWIVTKDGRVGIVRSPDYRVDWTHPAKHIGAEIPFAPIPLTETDKDHWRRGQRSAVFTRDANSRGTEPAVSMIPEPSAWPTHKPPFLPRIGSVLADPLGRIWVLRAAAAAEPSSVYDVFDAESRIVLRVTVPAQHRVVGFGPSAVYTTRADADDLLRLNRHELPR